MDAQTVRCHACHTDHPINLECPKGARNTYTPIPIKLLRSGPTKTPWICSTHGPFRGLFCEECDALPSGLQSQHPAYNGSGAAGDDPGDETGPVDPTTNPPNPKQRYGDLKVNLALVPPSSIEYEARALMEGARKYGSYNWRSKAVEGMTYIAANQRHMQAYLDGEDIDPDSGLPHLALAKACIGILIDSLETGCLIDNRPPKGVMGELLRRDMKEPS